MQKQERSRESKEEGEKGKDLVRLHWLEEQLVAEVGSESDHLMRLRPESGEEEGETVISQF